MVGEQQLSSLYKYARKRMAMNPTEVEKMNIDPNAEATPAAYGDMMIDMLLANLTPTVEQATSLKLFPTFSYYRVYRHGDCLKKHKDRVACEIAVTLCLGYTGEPRWPLWLESPDGDASVTLGPGDAVVYRGLECAHWRDALEGQEAVQAFLFYVDQNGPHSEFKFDKRQNLSSFRGLGKW
jgi:hypothetical protein